MKQERLKFIKELSNKEITLKSTAKNLGYSKCHTRRELKEYRVIRLKALTHKNTNKIPINKITQAKKGWNHQIIWGTILRFFNVRFSGN